MRFSLFLILFTHISFGAHPQGEWRLNKEKEGIKIFSRKSDRSSFNDIKVEMDLEGTIDQLRKILLDVEKYTEWAYSTSVSKLEKVISPDEFIYYSVISAPWPASDRDFYAKCILQENNGTLTMQSDVLPDYGPVEENKVRIPWSMAKWSITPKGDNQLHLEYTLQMDPGGNLPAWLVNLFSTTGPISTFSSLKEKMHALNN